MALVHRAEMAAAGEPEESPAVMVGALKAVLAMVDAMARDPARGS